MGAGGSYVTFYDDKIYTQTSSKNSGGAFNMGGITNALGIGEVAGALGNATTVGGSKINGVSVTSSNPRFLSIPPKGSVRMPTRKYSGGGKVTERYEYFGRPIYNGIEITKWTPRYYKEGELPPYLKFCFTYSDDPEFGTYSQMNSELYCYEIIGEMFKELPKDHFDCADDKDFKIGVSKKLHNGMQNFIYQRFDGQPANTVPVYNSLTAKRIR